MPIKKETPLVIPAKDAKTFPHTWLSELTVTAPSSVEGYLYLKLTPYDADSSPEELNLETSQGLHLDLWEVIDNVPEAATAMQAVFDAIPAIETYYEEGLLEEAEIE